MAFDTRAFEQAISRKKGLMDKLGDAGRFLRALVDSGEISEAAIKTAIEELERYTEAVFEDIESTGDRWHRLYRQIAELKEKMADAPPPVKRALTAEASVKLRSYDGFQSRIDGLTRNGVAAQVLVEKLHDVLLLLKGPMTEDAIDDWTTRLSEAIEARAVSDRALRELEGISKRYESASEPLPVERTEEELDKLTSTEELPRGEVERRLEEEF